MMHQLSNMEIYNTGAYKRRCRDPLATDVMYRDSGIAQVRPNWIAWYDPAFEFQRETFQGKPYIYTHCDPDDGALKSEIEMLSRNIRSRGLLNPVLISCRQSVWQLHPGKCRAAACKLLGLTKIPALFVDYTAGARIPEGFTEIRSLEQVEQLFTGDIAPEVRARGIRTPKRR